AAVVALIHCGDSTAPKTVTVTVTTDQQYILPGQSVVATIEVIPEGNETVNYVKIATTGVLTSSESLDVQLAGTFTATRTFTAPRAAGTGTLRVRATASAGGGRGNGEAVVAVADTTRPVIGSLSVTPADTAQLGDSVVISYTASDNAGLKYSILRLSGVVTLKDSIAEQYVSYVSHTRRMRISSTAAQGTLSATLEVADLGGDVVTTAATPLTVANRTRQAPWNAALGGTVRDMAFDTKRNTLYLSIPDSNRVAVLSLDSKSFTTPLAFSGQPRGLDLSLGSDSLLVALRATP